MKKFLVLASILLVLTLAFVACTGGDDPAESTGETGTVADPVTEAPTEAPTNAPDVTEEPTEEPTEAPTEEPTNAPETEEPTEEPTEPPTEPPVDPADPVWSIDAAGLAALTTSNNATVALTEDGYAGFTATDGDPWFMVAGNIGTMPEYLAIRYRTNTTQNGEIFIGSGGGPAAGASFTFNYNANSEWNLMVIHLPSVVNSITDGVIGHIRYDFYTGGAEDGAFLEIEYMAFFNSEEYAVNYDFEMHKAPMWDADKAVIAHQSFDQFYYGNGDHDEAAKDENLTLYHAANRPDWDFVADMVGKDHEYLTYWGWVATTSETIGQFGYQFNGGTPIYDAAWTHATEQPVIDAAKQLGGVNGSRMKIFIPVAGLAEGENSLRILYKDAEGNEVCLNEIIVKMPEPTPDTTMDVTVNASGNFGADAAVDATVNMTDSNLKDIFTTVTHVAGDQGVAINGADGAYFKAQGFSEAFVKMDGKYVYSFHALSSSQKQMASFFIRGAQSVKPEDTTGIQNILNNYFETDGKDKGHAGAGIQIWNQKRLFLGVKYYDESALTKIGTAYFLIEVDTRDADVSVFDDEDMIYITVNGELIATIELVGSGKSYEGLSVTGNATFAEKAIVTLYKPLKEGTADEYGCHPDENGQYVIENPLVVDTPMSDIGIANRTGTLEFSEISVKPLSSVEIPTLPGDEPDEPAVETIVVDPRTLPAGSITGHETRIVDSSDTLGHYPMVAAAGLETGAMIHQGSIYIGDYDLTSCTKIVIYYATDWGDGTQAGLAAAKEQGFGCLGVCAIDCNNVVNPDRYYFVGTPYTPDGGWAITAHEIDVTDLVYSGPVYVSADFLGGQFIIIDRVELVGATKLESEEPETPVVVHVSQDEMYYVDGNWNKIDGTDVYTPGDYDNFNGVVNYTKGTHAALVDWGWIALNTTDFQLGYIINGGEIAINADYIVAAGDDVMGVATQLGASNATRFKGIVLVSWLPVGEHNVKFVLQTGSGEIIPIREYTVVITEG